MSNQVRRQRWPRLTIGKKFALFFAGLLMVVTASVLMADRSLERLEGTGIQINLSGRMRYLTRNMEVSVQRYASLGIRPEQGELEGDLTRFVSSLGVLRGGGDYLGRDISPMAPALLNELSVLETAFTSYEKALRDIITAADRRLIYERQTEDLHARASAVMQAADRLTHSLALQGEAMQAEIRATLLNLTLINGALLLAGLLVVRVQFVLPLRKLAAASGRIAHGHYDERLEHSSGDEIGHLAEMFNEMAVRIQRDIEEIDRDNRALRKTRDELQTFSLAIEHSPATVVITDPQGVIQYVNPQFSESSGYSAAEAIGSSPSILKSGQTPASVYRTLWERIASGEQWRGEILNRKKSGELFWEDVWIAPIKDTEGNIFHYIAVKTDVTEKKEVALQLANMNEILEQRVAERTAQLTASNAELEAFSYSVSHDLRAPLRGISGFARLMTRDCADCPNHESLDYLGRIERAGLRMSEIIDDLLNLSRISRRKPRLEVVDLSRVARSVLEELGSAKPKRLVNIVVEDNVVVTGDASLLQIVLVNLLGNAWKYTAKRDDASITIGSRLENGKQVVLIADNGAGFDMQYADKLFGAFQRLHSHDEFEGTGIGLAIVQRIIHLHGGRIWAEGAVGQGATFYFTLS